MPEPDYEKLIRSLKSAQDALNLESHEGDASLWRMKLKILRLLADTERRQRKSRNAPSKRIMGYDTNKA